MGFCKWVELETKKDNEKISDCEVCMENNDKTDLLKFMSETHRREFNERRRHEIKIVLTVLTFYVLAGSSRFTEYFPDNLSHVFKVAIWHSFILLAIVSSVFLWFVHNANNTNKTIAERSENAIIGLMKNENITIDVYKKPFKGEGTVKWANWLWETIIFTLFALGSASILTLF